MNMTAIFNTFIQILVSNIIGYDIPSLNIYTSLYASIAILLASNTSIINKLTYSIILIITYITIFTFITASRMMYLHYSLGLTLVVFITMSFPIILWIILADNKTEVREELEVMLKVRTHKKGAKKRHIKN